MDSKDNERIEGAEIPAESKIGRKQGYYFCKLDDVWLLCYYGIGSRGFWIVPGADRDDTFQDDHFQEIDERQITHDTDIIDSYIWDVKQLIEALKEVRNMIDGARWTNATEYIKCREYINKFIDS